MKLKALDQVHISPVSADTLAPGTEFAISAAAGKELLKAHPDKFEQIDDDEPAEEAKEEKMEKAPENKSVGGAPENKAAPKPPASKGAAAAKPKGE